MIRSLSHSAASPDELGQHCRAGLLIDLLGNFVNDAAAARWLLEHEADDEAIAALESVISCAREIARTGRIFRDVHAKKAAASAAAARQHAEAVHDAESAATAQERGFV